MPAIAGLGTGFVVTARVATLTDDPLLLMFVTVIVLIAGPIVFGWGFIAHAFLTALGVVCMVPLLGGLTPNVVSAALAAIAASLWEAWALDRQRISRKAEELLRAGYERALERVASDAPPEETLGVLLGVLEQQAPGMVCALLTYDPTKDTLRVAASNGLPARLVTLLDGIPRAPDAPPPGAASAAGAPLLIRDLVTQCRDPRFAETALENGLPAPPGACRSPTPRVLPSACFRASCERSARRRRARRRSPPAWRGSPWSRSSEMRRGNSSGSTSRHSTARGRAPRSRRSSSPRRATRPMRRREPRRSSSPT